MTWSDILTLILSGGLITTLIDTVTQRKKNKVLLEQTKSQAKQSEADATKSIQDLYAVFSDMHKKEFTELYEKYEEEKTHNIELEKEKEYPFGRGKNRWVDMILHYRKTHIYCVTHKESGGLTVMETGCCGASVIIPNGFINPILASEVNSYPCQAEYKSIKVTIENAILNFNLQKNLEIANRYTWNDTIQKILKVMM